MTNFLIDNLLASRETSEQVFLTLDDNSEVTYASFCQRSNQIANYLIDSGLKPGDRVAMQVEKSWQALALYIGAIKAGGVFLPLNNAYTVNEIEYFVQDAQPRFFICGQVAAESLTSIATDADFLMLTLNQDCTGSFTDAVDNHDHRFKSVSRGPNNLAAILYTSGTTGRSKGAMLTHQNLWSNATTLAESWSFSSRDTLLHALPIFHTHGLFVATNTCIVAGAGMIFQSKFIIDKVVEKLPNATSMMGVPTFYTRLLDDQRFDQALVKHIRLFTSGSAPLLAETHVDFEQRTGHRILERYGMTETNMNTSNPYQGDRRAGTVGPALPGVHMRVVFTESNQPCGMGEIGAVQIKGPNVFKGYWKMPEKTAEEFTDDGYFITGDLGFLSDDNYLTIVGRDKDLIISGGYNIYPKEVELILDSLPGVTESAVIGVSHKDFGEAVVAVLTGDKTPSESEVKDLIKDQIARFKQPKKVFQIKELPRNSMGKVQKNLLRRQFAHCFQT